MDKNTQNLIDTRDNELTLVDLDDLRAAFGGEAAGAGAGAPQTGIEPVPGKTIMCPSW
ncbi:hypothetical protein SAMN02745121_01133 [Nannocystis exedens]|uniref:Uncharacterized protein n=1 Tax=Nannocystis exedens TaxID=54 RepID=A0A1I1UBW3_9BACT|nr:hypothetical protein [Nannocystis exedens]PCC71589.1 hypothetical protein NAEX_04666 [Nannocystis exedens]SFD68322.1 hypothetical protein SAMN02745121_01133 [Nannocystis exedens]